MANKWGQVQFLPRGVARTILTLRAPAAAIGSPDATTHLVNGVTLPRARAAVHDCRSKRQSRASGVRAQREARARIFLEGVYLTISLRAVSNVYRSNGSQPIANVAVGRGVFHATPPFRKKLYLSPFRAQTNSGRRGTRTPVVSLGKYGIP